MGIADTVDPLGGSYYVETLTNQFEEEIRKEMKKVDAWGGIVNAVATGKIQEAVSHQAYEREKAVQEGRIKKSGSTASNMKKKQERWSSILTMLMLQTVRLLN